MECRDPKSPGAQPNLAAVALGGLEAAVAQAAVGRGPTAGDDLQLLLGSVRPVQQLLDELLQPHFGVGLARRRLLEELVDLGDLPANKRWRGKRKSSNLSFTLIFWPPLLCLAVSYKNITYKMSPMKQNSVTNCLV